MSAIGVAVLEFRSAERLAAARDVNATSWHSRFVVRDCCFLMTRAYPLLSGAALTSTGRAGGAPRRHMRFVGGSPDSHLPSEVEKTFSEAA